jgi:hypothetical protein
MTSEEKETRAPKRFRPPPKFVRRDQVSQLSCSKTIARLLQTAPPVAVPRDVALLDRVKASNLTAPPSKPQLPRPQSPLSVTVILDEVHAFAETPKPPEKEPDHQRQEPRPTHERPRPRPTCEEEVTVTRDAPYEGPGSLYLLRTHPDNAEVFP